MKKTLLALLSVCLMFCALTACGKGNLSARETPTSVKTESKVTVKISPDKYTWYIKDYVGKNLAAVGYTALNGLRMDQYGNGYIKLVPVNTAGKYIDIENEDELKKYVVAAQNLEPNTEIKYIFDKDDNGNEYDNLVECQSIEEIVLFVKEVGTLSKQDKDLTKIKASTDIHTRYVKDYVGRNLYDCGYIALNEQFRDSYGVSSVKLILVTDDGTYIDSSNADILKKYKVTAQNIAPNTEIKYEFKIDSDGNESTSWPKKQNIEEIELSLTLVQE